MKSNAQPRWNGVYDVNSGFDVTIDSLDTDRDYGVVRCRALNQSRLMIVHFEY